ncbi:LppM family (lipo)protein [Demequina sp. SO4-18]|uniref:LppM family (lipo)protein n=1 Tax=Demequina sp. SO4-18 TaxID=3401026 RepID=UPI003B5CCDF4
MRNLTRGLALAVVSTLALTGCIRVEMNIDLAEDDTVSGDFIFAVSQELLEIAGEDGVEDLLGGEETIPGGTTERYESPDDDGDGSPDFVGTQTTFSELPLDEFAAAGEGLRIERDGDEFVVSGAADDLTDQTGGQELPDTATATMSITFPGDVSEHNGELDGNTVTWNLLEHSGEVQARGSASADSGFPLWMILVLAAVVGIGAGIAGVLVVSSRRKSTDESQTGAAPVTGTDPAAGDPIDAPPAVVAPGEDPEVAPTPAGPAVAPTREDPVDHGTPTTSDPADPHTTDTTDTTDTFDASDPAETSQDKGPDEDTPRP